jgi:hypothetical protein
MSSVVIAGNTSGTITLDAPNVAGTTVLTLPTANGTVLTTASTMPAGSVNQAALATGVAGNGPSFSVTPNGSGQIISAATTAKVTAFGITGDAVTYYWDTASCWNNTNKRFIPNVAGYYYFNTGLAIASIASGDNLGLAFFKNGTGIRYTSYFNNGGANDVYINGSCVIYMNGSTDYVEVYFSNNSGSNMEIRGEQYGSWFTGFLARAA